LRRTGSDASLTLVPRRRRSLVREMLEPALRAARLARAPAHHHAGTTKMARAPPPAISL